MGLGRIFQLIMLVFVVAIFAPDIDSVEPSKLGSVIESKLSQGKNSFENSRLANSDNENVRSLISGLQSISENIDPATIRQVIEHSEYAVRCGVKTAKANEAQLKYELKQAVGDDPEAVYRLNKMIESYYRNVSSAALNKSGCNASN